MKKPESREDKLERQYHDRRNAHLMRQASCTSQNVTYCLDYKKQECPLTCNYAQSRLEDELGEWSKR